MNEDSTDEPKLHKATLKENIPLLMICLVEDTMFSEMGSKFRDTALSNLVSSTSKDTLVKCLLMHYILLLAQVLLCKVIIIVYIADPYITSVSLLCKVITIVLISRIGTLSV